MDAVIRKAGVGWIYLWDVDRQTELTQRYLDIPEHRAELGALTAQMGYELKYVPYEDLCRDPKLCVGKSFCPRDTSCSE